MTIASTSQAPKRVVLNPQVAAQVAEILPPHMDLTTFVNHVLWTLYSEGVDQTLKGSLQPSKGHHASKTAVEISERSEEQPYKEVSLRAEEAHVEAEALEAVRAPSGLKRSQVTRAIDPAYQSLQCHADLIHRFWRAKKGRRSDRSWVLLLNGLTAIQAAYGDRVVREQLELGEASGWTNITLANYEKYGLPQRNAPAQAKRGTWEDLTERFGHLNGMSI